MMTTQIKKCVAATLVAVSVCAACAQSAVRDLANVAEAYTDRSREKREQEAAPAHIKEIFALAKKSAEEDFNVNFCGFFTGMSRHDAIALAEYYKLKEGEYSVDALPEKAVHRLWFSLKGVRRITKNGNTLEELAQAVANRVGDLKWDYKLKAWGHKTIDGVNVKMSKDGLSIQQESTELCVAGIIESMVAILGKNFKMGKYEVTQKQWSVVMGTERPSKYKGDDYPVYDVSLSECKEFLEKLNVMPIVKASGLRFRLPKEAEWEFACRAGGTGDYCRLADGTEITRNTLGVVAWYDGNSDDTPHPVGMKKPNAFGLYDILGNAWEQCEDRNGRRGGVFHNNYAGCSCSYWGAEGEGGLRLVADTEEDRQKEKAIKEAARQKEEAAAAVRAAEKERAAKEALPRLIRDMIAIPGKNFKMGKYEVTQAQWQVVMGNNPSYYKGDYNPVEKISWVNCKKFLEKLNALPEVNASGLIFRLPTEAEWEYACRAGGTGNYCRLADGTEITTDTLGKVAWYEENSKRTTHPVGQKEPNAFGLYDMHGNVWEWCEDLYEVGWPNRVFRGGDWDCTSGRCTAGNREYGRPCDDCGFRLVAEDRKAETARKEFFVQDIVENMVAIPGKNYKIGRYEVTLKQWQGVMGGTPTEFKGDNHPVEPPLHECKKFLEKLNAMPEVKASGMTFRLPTEKEWEYACRGGKNERSLFGGGIDYCRLKDGSKITERSLGKVAWYSENSGRKPHPVGQKMPNAFGLYDMLGNVRELCVEKKRKGESDDDEEKGRLLTKGGCYEDSAEDCKLNISWLMDGGVITSPGLRLAADQK